LGIARAKFGAADSSKAIAPQFIEPFPALLVSEGMAHTLNVVVHVAFGAFALIAGLIPLVTPKGGRWHVRFGRLFLLALTGVVVTAILGITFFGFRAFLGVITMLSAYEAYSASAPCASATPARAL
jgi:hypothetical protein